MTQMEVTWKQVLDMMAGEIAKSSFDSWLSQTRASYQEGNTLYIEVPNQFTRDWVEARYALALRKTLRHVTDQDWELRFVLPQGFQSDKLSKRSRFKTAQISAVEEQMVREATASPLNPKYTFDTFVVGSGNRFAHAASLAVAEAPARAYNPLFLYGGVGLGKTHLMHAIGHFALDQEPDIKVMYVTSETFTNDLIHAIGKKSMVDFRNKYRNVDILLVDDIQFVAGKESTQEEFFHTFNALYEANKQLIISSDRPPKEIPTLEERLRSRFEWGLTTDIQAPDLETRIAILQKKAHSERITVDDDVLTYIARHIQSNIRELEGAFVRVLAYANLNSSPLNMETAVNGLKDILPSQSQRPVTIDRIQKAVADHFGIKISDMKSKKRTRSIAFPRQVAMFLTRDLTETSLPAIGEEFGGRDHTTVIHACEKIQRALQTDPSLQASIKDITEVIHRP